MNQCTMYVSIQQQQKVTDAILQAFRVKEQEAVPQEK